MLADTPAATQRSEEEAAKTIGVAACPTRDRYINPDLFNIKIGICKLQLYWQIGPKTTWIVPTCVIVAIYDPIKDCRFAGGKRPLHSGCGRCKALQRSDDHGRRRARQGC
jgi:hypothetical protein